MNEHPVFDKESEKFLLARIVSLEARCDALFACLTVISQQVGNPPDLLNSLMKGVSSMSQDRTLGKISDIHPNLATDLKESLEPPARKEPDGTVS